MTTIRKFVRIFMPRRMVSTTTNGVPGPAMNGIPGPAQAVGCAFVRQYYSMLNAAPWRLHEFYKESSCLIHGAEEDTLFPICGQQVHF